MHTHKKNPTTTKHNKDFFFKFVNRLSLIQALNMRTRAEKKLDLNASYTNTHTTVEEKKILPGAGNRTSIEAFTPHQVCLSFGALHHSTILPMVILFFYGGIPHRSGNRTRCRTSVHPKLKIWCLTHSAILVTLNLRVKKKTTLHNTHTHTRAVLTFLQLLQVSIQKYMYPVLLGILAT